MKNLGFSAKSTENPIIGDAKGMGPGTYQNCFHGSF